MGRLLRNGITGNWPGGKQVAGRWRIIHTSADELATDKAAPEARIPLLDHRLHLVICYLPWRYILLSSRKPKLRGHGSSAGFGACCVGFSCGLRRIICIRGSRKNVRNESAWSGPYYRCRRGWFCLSAFLDLYRIWGLSICEHVGGCQLPFYRGQRISIPVCPNAPLSFADVPPRNSNPAIDQTKSLKQQCLHPRIFPKPAKRDSR
jgi:hypothetical protein